MTQGINPIEKERIRLTYIFQSPCVVFNGSSPVVAPKPSARSSDSAPLFILRTKSRANYAVATPQEQWLIPVTQPHQDSVKMKPF